MQRFTEDIKLSAPIPILGLSEGDSLQDALEAIAKRIHKQDELLEREIYPSATVMTTDDIKYTGEGFTITGMGPEAKFLEENAQIKIETVKGEADVELKFNAQDFDLPEGAVIASSIVNVSGELHMGRTTIANTKQAAGTINVPYARFPITLDATIVVATPKGDVELRKTTQISSDKDLAEQTPFTVTDRTIQPKPESMTEVIQQMQTRLKSAEKKK